MLDFGISSVVVAAGSDTSGGAEAMSWSIRSRSWDATNMPARSLFWSPEETQTGRHGRAKRHSVVILAQLAKA